MSDAPERPQIYLITPAEMPELQVPRALAEIVDAVEIACLRLRAGSDDLDQLARSADVMRAFAHERDLPLVIETHLGLVERLGLDGVHLTDGSKSVRTARKDLGSDAIIGAYCGNSRHDGMTAGELEADYVSFGPLAATPLIANEPAERDLFAWWSEMIEVPVVAEGALLPLERGFDAAQDLAPLVSLGEITDFFAFGSDLWRQDDPVAILKALDAAL
ncbi:MAG: thiamine phosphate synthase [Mangrovicoccus sp.]